MDNVIDYDIDRDVFTDKSLGKYAVDVARAVSDRQSFRFCFDAFSRGIVSSVCCVFRLRISGTVVGGGHDERIERRARFVEPVRGRGEGREGPKTKSTDTTVGTP